MYEKLKSYVANDQIFYGFLVIFVAILSFFLGRASVAVNHGILPAPAVVMSEFTQTSVKGASERETANKEPEKQPEGGEVVASKSGQKYHRKDCPGASQIKPANLISFPSALLARASGYTPASNCPGLE